MSSIVSGIGRAISGVVKGVTDIVKSVASSGLGKALIMGAAIYFGGAALMGGFGEAGLAGGGSFFEGASAGLSNAATGISEAWSGLTGATEAGTGSTLSGVESITGDMAGTGAGAAPAAGTIAESSAVLPGAAEASALTDTALSSAGTNPGIVQGAMNEATGAGMNTAVSAAPGGAAIPGPGMPGYNPAAGFTPSYAISAPSSGSGIVNSAMNQATGTGFWNGLGTTGKGMAILAGTNLAGGLIQGAAAENVANQNRNRYNANVGTRLWNT